MNCTHRIVYNACMHTYVRMCMHFIVFESNSAMPTTQISFQREHLTTIIKQKTATKTAVTNNNNKMQKNYTPFEMRSEILSFLKK